LYFYKIKFFKPNKIRHKKSHVLLVLTLLLAIHAKYKISDELAILLQQTKNRHFFVNTKLKFKKSLLAKF